VLRKDKKEKNKESKRHKSRWKNLKPAAIKEGRKEKNFKMAMANYKEK